ncbi:MAG: hypothetical protein K9G49_16580 [Taibaiella sp.]|nr:hypothetical protein [Taibaiella sp.]
MKLLQVLLLALLIPSLIFAQEVTVKEGNVKMGKTKIWCYQATYNYDKAITIETIEADLGRANLKRTKKKKGFCIYRGVSWAEMSNNKADYIYKTKTKKGKTTVYLSASKGYDNFVTTKTEPEFAGKIIAYLNKLNGEIANTLAIRAKEQELKSIEKKNEEINKQLAESKKQEAEKAKELQNLKRVQTAPAPVK